MLNLYQRLNYADECVTPAPVHEPPLSISQVWWRSGAFSYSSQSDVIHSLSWWCRNAAHTVKAHELKRKDFVVFSRLRKRLFFTVGRQNLFAKIWSLREKKTNSWISNSTPVLRHSAEISQIRVIYKEIYEVLWQMHTCHFVKSLCSELTAQLTISSL